MTDQELKDFLNQEPENVRQNDDGSLYVDIVQVEEDLTIIDPYWSTRNFRCREINQHGILYISGNLTVELTIGVGHRNLVGASTLRMAEDFTHAEAILKSECIKNAVKAMGRRFGRYLNDRGMQPTQGSLTSRKKGKPEAVALPPDAGILAQYAKAMEEGDVKKINLLESIYDFNATT